MVGKQRQRYLVWLSLLLPIWLASCANDTDLQAIQADRIALERQSSTRQQTVEARVQQLSDRVAQFEQSQSATRREVARAAATLDELRIQLQRLRGDAQETLRQVQRSASGGAGISAAKLADWETRLGELEKQLGVPAR
jgi:phage shock protein A